MYRTDRWYEKGKLKQHFQGKLRGYPGLKHTAHLIANYIPQTKIYVEPFAGKARTAKFTKPVKMVLNDKSEYAINYLKKNFKNALITNHDFLKCMDLWDSPQTFFLIDPPWSQTMYDKNSFNDPDKEGIILKPFVDRTPNQYYQDIYKRLESIKGDWIICANHKRKMPNKINKISLYEKIIKSPKKINGYHVKVKLLSNIPFEMRNKIQQLSLEKCL